MISYIVSVYDRILSLACCLSSLRTQGGDSEIFVCCNHVDPAIIVACGIECEYHGAKLLKTGLNGAQSCYESAEMAAEAARGEWLCFPSDDSIYVAEFSQIMLNTAHHEQAGLVYCDCVYRQSPAAGSWPPYTVLETRPHMGRIDKTCFILCREAFKGFPPHPRGWRDGALIEQLITRGVKHAKAPGVLVVHQ